MASSNQHRKYLKYLALLFWQLAMCRISLNFTFLSPSREIRGIGDLGFHFRKYI